MAPMLTSAADTSLCRPSPCLHPAADATLYEFQGGAWKERGRGEVRLNLAPGAGRARLVMRQKGSQRLLLNAALYPAMATSKMMGGKGVTFAAANAAAPLGSEEGGSPSKANGGEASKADAADTSSSAPAAGAAAAAAAIKTYALKCKAPDKIDEFVSLVEVYKGRPASGAAEEEGAAAGEAGAADAV